MIAISTFSFGYLYVLLIRIDFNCFQVSTYSGSEKSRFFGSTKPHINTT